MGVFLYVSLSIVVIGCVFLVFFIYKRLRNKIRRKKIERIMGTKLTGSDQAIIETAGEFGIYFGEEQDEDDDEEDVQFVFFRKDLPFTPSRFQIIYVEDEYDSKANEYIKANFDKISTLLAANDYQFCYIPYGSVSNETIKYYYPNLTDKDIIIDNSHLTTYQDLFLYTTKRTPLKSGFICYYDEDVENEDEIDNDADWDSISLYKFAYLEISQYPELSIEELLLFYINEKCYRPDRYYIPPTSGYDADYEFDYAQQQLIDAIRERVERLKQLGINEMVLKSLIAGEQKLSKLIISKGYKIYLSDYNNKEIILYPLVKAIFFLFLRHPEGILFKNLPDYKNELKDIYLKISNRELLDDIDQSIESVTNPTKNSINEKCSRIREAFVKEFDESLAQYYFITGERNTPKKISLDRKLVTWEMEI